MAYTSLRDRFVPVAKAPPELRAFCAGMRKKRSRARALLLALLESPRELVIGTYRPDTQFVYPPSGKCFPWVSGNGTAAQTTLGYGTVWKMVVSLQRTLAFHGLPYGVWKSSEAGHGQPWRGGHVGGYRYTRDEVPYKIGLVDRRRPLTRRRGNGHRAA